MSHQNVAHAYDQLTSRWLDRNFNQNNGVEQHRRALAFLAPSQGAFALNVGCGCNTRFNALIRSYGLELEGIDISSKMVELAQISEPNMTIHHADICDWTPQKQYRFITAWDSIWHVELSKQRELMKKLFQMLDIGGVMIFSAGGLHSPDEHRNNAMGPELYYSTLGIPELLRITSEANCVCKHLEFEKQNDKHVYLIVQRCA